MADVENLKIGNVSYEIRDNKAFHQYDTLPEANESRANAIVEYVGNNTATLTYGYVYQCQPYTVPFIDQENILTQYITINSIDAKIFKEKMLLTYPTYEDLNPGLYTLIYSNDGNWLLDCSSAYPGSSTLLTIDDPTEYGFVFTVEEYQENATLVSFVYQPEKELYTFAFTEFGGDMANATIDNDIMLVGTLCKAYGGLLPSGNDYKIMIPEGSAESKIIVLQVDGNDYTIGNKSYGVLGLSIQPSGISYSNGSYIKFNFTKTPDYYYKWVRKNVQPSVEIYNDLDTAATDLALSANMGRVLADRINNIGTVGRFLAMWDSDTGIARYLDNDFEYERGDYYIVATTDDKYNYPEYDKQKVYNIGDKCKVGDPSDYYICNDNNVTGEWDSTKWNQHTITNYKPNGEFYEGPSTVVETEDVHVSDMYYYDGTNWIYMDNHTRQIAIDETLSTTSINPVENRVVTSAINNKQDTLISGTNIKYINGNSILGEGNLVLETIGNIDGGKATSHYISSQNIDGGKAVN